jgi:hypothetical protein
MKRRVWNPYLCRPDLMTKTIDDYPRLLELRAWIAERDLTLAVELAAADLANIDTDARVIIATAPRRPDIRVTVFDEYGDARPDNPLLCLLLIDDEFAELADADGVAAWARAHGLDPGLAAIEAIHASNSRAQRQFHKSYGPIPQVLAAMDWQLNAGAAQYLRRR